MITTIHTINVEEDDDEAGAAEPTPLRDAQRLLYRVAEGRDSTALLRQLAARYLADTMTPADVRLAFGGDAPGRRRVA